ncbi:hypothetical protein E4U41_005143 [Claviceps citrina]|nr:hypothetical protein E4U41_005143 [Claviceps citrina]
MGLKPSWASAILALGYGLAAAKPLLAGGRLQAAATLDIQPVVVLTEVHVTIEMYCPRPTYIVICDGHTMRITRSGLLQTVMTITYTERRTTSRQPEDTEDRPPAVAGTPSASPTRSCAIQGDVPGASASQNTGLPVPSEGNVAASSARKKSTGRPEPQSNGPGPNPSGALGQSAVPVPNDSQATTGVPSSQVRLPPTATTDGSSQPRAKATCRPDQQTDGGGPSRNAAGSPQTLRTDRPGPEPSGTANPLSLRPDGDGASDNGGDRIWSIAIFGSRTEGSGPGPSGTAVGAGGSRGGRPGSTNAFPSAASFIRTVPFSILEASLPGPASRGPTSSEAAPSPGLPASRLAKSGAGLSSPTSSSNLVSDGPQSSGLASSGAASSKVVYSIDDSRLPLQLSALRVTPGNVCTCQNLNVGDTSLGIAGHGYIGTSVVGL